MTPWKSYTGKTLPRTICTAWGTEGNADFFFSRLSLVQGHTRAGSGLWPLESATPALSEFNVRSPRNEWKRHRWALPRLGCQGTKAGLRAALCWGSSHSAGNFYHADFPSTCSFSAGCGWGVRLIVQIPPTRRAATMGNTQWRTAAWFRRDFRARSLHLPAVSATSQSGRDLTLSILNWWAERIHKEPASIIQSVPDFHCPPPAPPPSQRRGVTQGSRPLWHRRLPHHCWWAQRGAEGYQSREGSQIALLPALSALHHTSGWLRRWGVGLFWFVRLSGSVDEQGQARPRPQRVKGRVGKRLLPQPCWALMITLVTAF